MKIIIVTSFPFPEGKATANRVSALSEGLLKSDAIDLIEIISCSPEPSKEFQYSSGIKVRNIKNNIIKKDNLLFRAFNELLLSLRVWRYIRRENNPNIILTVPSILFLIPYIIYPKMNFLALDIRDAVWTYMPSRYFGFSLSFISKTLFIIAAKKSDLVSVTNLTESKKLQDISGVQSTIVPNGISNKKYLELIQIPMRSMSGKTKLTYIGNIGIAQELDILVDLAKKFKNSIQIKLIGDGARLGDLKKRCQENDISNLIFHGLVSGNEVSQFLDESDVLFAQIGKNFSSAVPTKIFEYIVSGRKIILGLPEGLAKEIFSKFLGVEIFESGDLHGLINAYIKILEFDYNESCRKYNCNLIQSNFIREKNISNYINQIETILRNR